MPVADSPLGGEPVQEWPRSTIATYEWVPTEPAELEVARFAMTCLSGADGSRRFVPVDDRPTFVLKASVGGCEILADTYGLSAPHRSSYHAMRLIYQIAPRLRENLCRAFRRERDLYVTRPERSTSDMRSILPDHCGRTSDGLGEKWSVAELLAQGRTAAESDGCRNPNQETCIRYGIIEAARRNPIDVDSLDEAEACTVIRTALFGAGPADEPPDEVATERVTERLLVAIEGHHHVDSLTFRRWFYGDPSALVRAIAKQKKPPGGPLAEELVRQTLLELVQRSLHYVGDSFHAQLRIFAQMLPEPLSDREQAAFDALYQRQPCLGGLPLVLLFDHLQPLRELVVAIMTEPTDRTLWGALLRGLEIHAQMVLNKRESERHYKRQRGSGRNWNPLSLRDPAQLAAKTSSNDVDTSVHDDLQNVAAELRKRRDARCACDSWANWHAKFAPRKGEKDALSFVDACRACGHCERIEISGNEARAIRQMHVERKARRDGGAASD